MRQSLIDHFFRALQKVNRANFCFSVNLGCNCGLYGFTPRFCPKYVCTVTWELENPYTLRAGIIWRVDFIFFPSVFAITIFGTFPIAGFLPRPCLFSRLFPQYALDHHRRTVRTFVPKCIATLFCVCPAFNIPIAWLRTARLTSLTMVITNCEDNIRLGQNMHKKSMN